MCFSLSKITYHGKDSGVKVHNNDICRLRDFALWSLTFEVTLMTGNGLFLSRMAKKRKDLNFLGLEINGKVVCFVELFIPGFINFYPKFWHLLHCFQLVNRCLEDVSQFGIKNGYVEFLFFPPHTRVSHFMHEKWACTSAIFFSLKILQFKICTALLVVFLIKKERRKQGRVGRIRWMSIESLFKNEEQKKKEEKGLY